MTYKEFENQVANTFNRMHIVESCDDDFAIDGAECDVQLLLIESFMKMFHIEYSRTHYGYTVRATILTYLFINDDDNTLEEALQSFNNILDKYNVVFNANPVYASCHLHIV